MANGNSNQPLNAYVVNEYEHEGKKQEEWTRVGVAFPHKSGTGFNLIINTGLSVSGKIVVRERKPEDARGED